jgi:hypothetical protein
MVVADVLADLASVPSAEGLAIRCEAHLADLDPVDLALLLDPSDVSTMVGMITAANMPSADAA